MGDLVAEPFPPIESPKRATVEGATIAVDSVHEILVSKLAALLGRAELRDLVDVKALLDSGGDLSAAVRDAPEKDTGFSAMTLAWVLHSLDIAPLARASGWNDAEVDEIRVFQQQLVSRLMDQAKPE